MSSVFESLRGTGKPLNDEYRAGRVEFHLNAEAINNIAVMAPVPEPRPYLMLAASLFVIAFARKRRYIDGNHGRAHERRILIDRY
jgi:hypothetical protein